MKQATISIVALLALVVGMYLFFTYGGNTPSNDPAAIKELQIQDPLTTKGDSEAPVRIVEYADVLCPYCAEINQQQLPQLEKDYIDEDQVHFELRLVAVIDPDNSQRAAEAAYCAADQEAFWSFIDEVYSYTWKNYYQKGKKPTDITEFEEGEIAKFASRIKELDVDKWQKCLDRGEHTERIEDNQREMARLGGSGTPLFNINGKHINGAAPPRVFASTIDAALSEAEERQAYEQAD